MMECKFCHEQRSESGKCAYCGSDILPDDYEGCGDCLFDHGYEYELAAQWHLDNPCSYCKYNRTTGHELDCTTVCRVTYT